MTTYAFDQPVVVTIRTFSDEARTIPADPTTLSLDLLAPDGTETTSTWAGGGIVRTQLGVFTWTNTPVQSGDFAYHTKSTGAVATGGDGSFTVLAKYGAQTLDILTLSEAYIAINDATSAEAGTGQYDAMLEQMVAAVSGRIDDVCGPVVIRTISNEEHPARGGRIYLRKRPVASVTTLTEYVGLSARVLVAENFPSATTGNDYKLLDDGRTGVVERRSNGYSWPFASGTSWGRVTATYRAGRYASTELVDQKFKQAAASILLRLFKREGGAWSTGGDPFAGGVGFFRAIDPMIDEFLADERLLRNYA